MKSINKFWWVLACIGLFTIRIQAQETAVKKSENNLFDISKNLDIMANMFKELNVNYVNPIDVNELSNIGIKAMLKTLDPYTVLYTESDMEDYLYQRTGVYKGIGIKYTKSIDSNTVITDVVQDGPADLAGLVIGDTIMSINNKSLLHLTLSDIENFLKRVDGDELNLELDKAFTGKKVFVTVKKDEVDNNDLGFIGWADEKEDIAVVKLNRFVNGCSRKVEDALDSLFKKNKDLKGVVLDLRHNPGGLLSEAVNLVNVFVDKGNLVVFTKGKFENNDYKYYTKSPAKYDNIPLTVLVDTFSASASEIVSGCIQDYDRGIIIGENTYGKGLVQHTKQLSFNSQMKLTTSKYYIPSERCIQAIDYNKKDEDGKPYIVKESERGLFKTKGGRPVKDGRGVSPDIYIENKMPQSIKELKTKNIFFDFVSNNVDVSKLDAKTPYKSTDQTVEKFYSWLGNSTSIDKIEIFDEWHKFYKNAQTGNLLPVAELKVMEKSLKDKFLSTLKVNHTEIKTQIENEVNRRRYTDQEIYEQMKKTDDYLNNAIKVLRDTPKYKSILGK